MEKNKADVYFELLQFAEKWYPPKKLQHASRVAAYSFQDAQERSDIDSFDAAIVGLAHDLVEDTDAPEDAMELIIGHELAYAVWLLTKADDVSYNDYIMNIVSNKSNCPIAFLVKKADMKDHMAQADTLTDKLKNKYLPVLHYFL